MTTVLSFSKQDNGTLAAFAVVKSRFTLSLVRRSHGEVRIYVSSTEGGAYSPFQIPAIKTNEPLVCEKEFSFNSISTSAPKYLKIVSYADIESGTIVESGVQEGGGLSTIELEELKKEVANQRVVNDEQQAEIERQKAYDQTQDKNLEDNAAADAELREAMPKQMTEEELASIKGLIK